MSNYLVTGGAGFIGSHTVDELIRRGNSVKVLDDMSNCVEKNLFNPDALYICGSVTDAHIVNHAMQGVDYVIHLAAKTSVVESFVCPREYDRVNVGGTIEVLLSAWAAKVKRIVIASSSAVYGNLEKCVENMVPDPISPYAISKATAETYAYMYARMGGTPFIALRYFNVYGPGQRAYSPYAGVIPRFCSSYMTGNSPIVFGDGEQTRDFIYVGDVAEANRMACEYPGIRPPAINIGNGRGHSLNVVLRLLEHISGSLVKPEFREKRPGDIRYSVSDDTIRTKWLRMVPKTSLEVGLRKTYEWYLSKASK